jgi:nitrous oxidase accessory protein NosD
MKNQSTWLVVAWLLISTAMSGGGTVRVKPTEPLSAVREKLAADASITEVIFEEGVYLGGLAVDGPKGTDFAQHPLLIRAADGAEVVLDGARPVENFQACENLPGVFWIDYAGEGGEYPKFWEPRTRVRYRLAADRRAVARFPATYSIEGKRLLFHTSDGRAPGSGDLLMSAQDYGMFINRPYVTVRGIAFRNFLVREKWSTAIDLRVDHIVAEDCRSSNCSLGFIITGNGNVVRRCTAEDVGGGVYVGGEDATVEGCRLHKQRDSFMVPMYAQDDTGIQYYSPARGGVIRGNLCEGFGMGVFIKANTAPYVVEHNTLVGLGQGLGFGATSWHPQQRFRYNIVADCDRQAEIYVPEDGPKRDINHNCYWSSARSDLKTIGADDIVADPKFVWPQWKDYRLANDSPCAKLADEAGPCGAFGLVGDAPLDLGPARQWHVSESGRDGRDGSAEQPVRTIQFAVDRAKPGDTIILQPGFYPEPVRIARGGTKDHPLVVRAAEPGQAVLDSNRSASVMIGIYKAPYVEIDGLEIRWYGQVAIDIEESPHVTVTGCRIWNAHWHGAWPTGHAVRVVRSPGFVGRDDVLFRQEHGFWFYNSPNVTLTQNTCVANLYSAACFLYSCENSTCRNNSFTFQGNDVIVIEENLGEKKRLATFDCDYNNYGTALREQPHGTVFDSIMPRETEGFLFGYSKAIVNYTEYRGEMKRFVSLAEWREFSGLDQHTLFADPLYRDSAGRDFRLDVKSPNRGAGADGATIGTLGD